ncbi:hypothetical protein [Caldisalinibacter kiritimatiensis]|uniref:Uncharacterized protein n=1 Tax=Caldisalinibacter kiritimatiensis TaxID=1304284 RepID=R1CBN7_9FIRM|nr:hypothetical protein [Caldisalinibacter kiritimatiensis]EOC99734.1 hypothetical protein L21TH_2264 [Caldisalinibacter kiritimatiensis]
MSIKPIDMQLSFSKAQQVSKTQQIHDNTQKEFIINQINDTNKNIKRQQKQINKSQKGHESKIKRDNEEKGRGRNKKKRRRERENKKNNSIDKKKIKKTIGGKLDIKV